MNRGRFCLAAVATIVSLSNTPAVQARVVEYLMDRAAVLVAAGDQQIEGPFAEIPAHGHVDLALETPSAADHRAVIASIYCQAYKVENPLSTLLGNLALAADDDGKLGNTTRAGAGMTIQLLKGSSFVRCLGTGELQTACKVTVKINAEARFKMADGSIANVPLVASVERKGKVGGFCGHIARYIGIISREAGIDLIRQAERAYQISAPNSIEPAS
jgi:hypothetical protein